MNVSHRPASLHQTERAYQAVQSEAGLQSYSFLQVYPHRSQSQQRPLGCGVYHSISSDLSLSHTPDSHLWPGADAAEQNLIVPTAHKTLIFRAGWGVQWRQTTMQATMCHLPNRTSLLKTLYFFVRNILGFAF